MKIFVEYLLFFYTVPGYKSPILLLLAAVEFFSSLLPFPCSLSPKITVFAFANYSRF